MIEAQIYFGRKLTTDADALEDPKLAHYGYIPQRIMDEYVDTFNLIKERNFSLPALEKSMLNSVEKYQKH